MYDAEELEKRYRSLNNKPQRTEFAEELENAYRQQPDNTLLVAWHYRLCDAGPNPKNSRGIWLWPLLTALPLSAVLLLYYIFEESFSLKFEDVVFPLMSLGVLAYLALASRGGQAQIGARRFGFSLAIVLASLVYSELIARTVGMSEHLRDQWFFFTLLICWFSVSFSLLGFTSEPRQRFLFLNKSLHLLISAFAVTLLLYLVAFVSIQLFGLLDIQPKNEDWIYVALLGLVPSLTLALGYDPRLNLATQELDSGLERFLGQLFRILLLPIIIILLLYLASTLRLFWLAFQNRDTLIVYNFTQLALILFLIGVIPTTQAAAPQQEQRYMRRLRLLRFLRWGLFTLAALAALLSLYALAAVLYRTWNETLSINRLTIILANLLNIGLFGSLVLSQAGKCDWQGFLRRLQACYQAAFYAYFAWAILSLLILPFLPLE